MCLHLLEYVSRKSCKPRYFTDKKKHGIFDRPNAVCVLSLNSHKFTSNIKTFNAIPSVRFHCSKALLGPTCSTVRPTVPSEEK